MGPGNENDCCLKFMKYSLFFFNFVFLILSIVVVTYAGITLGVTFSEENADNDEFQSVRAFLIIIIAIALFIVLVSFLGSFGAGLENRCLLLMYSIFIFIIFLASLTLGILSLVHGSTILDKLQDFIKEKIEKKNVNDQVLKKILNAIGDCFDSSFNEDKCEKAVKDMFHKYKDATEVGGYIAIGISAVMLICMSFACALFLKS